MIVLQRGEAHNIRVGLGNRKGGSRMSDRFPALLAGLTIVFAAPYSIEGQQAQARADIKKAPAAKQWTAPLAPDD